VCGELGGACVRPGLWQGKNSSVAALALHWCLYKAILAKDDRLTKLTQQHTNSSKFLQCFCNQHRQGKWSHFDWAPMTSALLIFATISWQDPIDIPEYVTGHDHRCLCCLHPFLWASRSLVKRLFLPLFWVEADESVVRLHLNPSHLVCHIHPSLRLEELVWAELGSVVRHVVKHVEENGVRESLNCWVWQALRLAHVVALRDANVHLKAVVVVYIA